MCRNGSRPRRNANNCDDYGDQFWHRPSVVNNQQSIQSEKEDLEIANG
jgi:hypothetical protein